MKFDFTKEPGKIRFSREYALDGDPLISVVTPYYNAHDYFEYLYPCVMNQTFPWFEWIIVNDGSTHEMAKEQLATLEARDQRIKVINKENGGSSSARNRGIKESKADIIVTLDADELIESTYFEVLYWALYYNPDCSWAYTDSVGFQAQEYTWNPPFDVKRLKKDNFLTESAAIRKNDLMEVGCYDEVEKFYYEDWRLWLKLLSKSKRPIHVNGFEFWYRRTDNGALNKIATDREMKRKAEILASEAAENVDENVQSKNYYGQWQKDRLILPKKTDFKKTYLGKKEKTNLLFLISNMTGKENYELVRLINKENYDVTVVSTDLSKNEFKQQYRSMVQDVFSLPDFLDPENYAEFISYIIETRKIDVCVISQSIYGYYLLPWLKAEYPRLAIFDYIPILTLMKQSDGLQRMTAMMDDFLEKTFVCNQTIKNCLSDHLNKRKERIEVLPEKDTVMCMEQIMDVCLSMESKERRIETGKSLKVIPALTANLCALYDGEKYACSEIIEHNDETGKLQKLKMKTIFWYVKKVVENIQRNGIKNTCKKILLKLSNI